MMLNWQKRKRQLEKNLSTLNHITNAQRTALEGQINQATTVDGVNTVKQMPIHWSSAMNNTRFNQ